MAKGNSVLLETAGFADSQWWRWFVVFVPRDLALLADHSFYPTFSLGYRYYRLPQATSSPTMAPSRTSTWLRKRHESNLGLNGESLPVPTVSCDPRGTSLTCPG